VVFDSVLTIEHTLHHGDFVERAANTLLGRRMTIITTGTTTGTTIISSRTFDHRTSSTHRGGPASRYRRVERARVVGRIDRPNYAARRLGALVVALGSVVVMAALINSMLVGLGGSPASAAEATAIAAADASTAVVAPAIHVAAPGDSLWSVADQHRGSVDRDRYVDALIELNGSTSIVVGQAVHLP
jgi:hypothetical protein